MLTELTRVNVIPSFQGGNSDYGPYINFPACAAVGSTFFAGDLEWQPGNAQIILRLFGPFDSPALLAPPQLAAQAPLGLWLYQLPGPVLGAAVLHIPDDADDHSPSLLMLAIDPATGEILSSSDLATGLAPTHPPQRFWSTYLYPSFVEQNGGSLLLWRPVAVGSADRQFRALRDGSGAVSFTAPSDPDLEPVPVHGVSLDSIANLYDGTDEVWVPPPGGMGGYGYGYWPLAAMWRQSGGPATLVLSLGFESQPVGPGRHGYFLAYDLCLYGGELEPSGPPSWWEGQLQDDGWSPAWGSGTLPEAIIPSLPGNGTVVITNPADPDDPWAWANLPPGAGQNDWMSFYVDGDWVQIHYGGRVVLVWRMPPSVYQHFLSGGASMGFYNSITKQWQAEPPPGWPPAKPAPLNGWAYLVDSRHRVSETGDRLTRYGTRIDADDVLVFPGDYALVGQALQDDVIQSAPIKHIAGRDLPEVVLSRDDALLVWDAGYGHYLYPVEEAP